MQSMALAQYKCLSQGASTFSVSCPRWAICKHRFSTISFFSGFTNAILDTAHSPEETLRSLNGPTFYSKKKHWFNWPCSTSFVKEIQEECIHRSLAAGWSICISIVCLLSAANCLASSCRHWPLAKDPSASPCPIHEAFFTLRVNYLCKYFAQIKSDHGRLHYQANLHGFEWCWAYKQRVNILTCCCWASGVIVAPWPPCRRRNIACIQLFHECLSA